MVCNGNSCLACAFGLSNSNPHAPNARNHTTQHANLQTREQHKIKNHTQHTINQIFETHSTSTLILPNQPSADTSRRSNPNATPPTFPNHWCQSKFRLHSHNRIFPLPGAPTPVRDNNVDWPLRGNSWIRWIFFNKHFPRNKKNTINPVPISCAKWLGPRALTMLLCAHRKTNDNNNNINRGGGATEI